MSNISNELLLCINEIINNISDIEQQNKYRIRINEIIKLEEENKKCAICEKILNYNEFSKWQKYLCISNYYSNCKIGDLICEKHWCECIESNECPRKGLYYCNGCDKYFCKNCNYNCTHL